MKERGGGWVDGGEGGVPINTNAQKRKKTPRPVVEGKGTCSSQAQGEGATHVLRRGGGDMRDTETKETEG